MSKTLTVNLGHLNSTVLENTERMRHTLLWSKAIQAVA